MSFSYDPYDIWSTEFLGRLKVSYTKGHFFSKIIVLFIGILELVAPISFRHLLGIKMSQFPHIEAMKLFYEDNNNDKLSLFKKSAITVNNGVAWGLPFKWFSKNGNYDCDTPYVTNTPYVMEALVRYNWQGNEGITAHHLFCSTWFFLESLKILYHSDKELALSYAPIDEPRMVVNANTYTAFAYALHAIYGDEHIKEESKKRVFKLINWVIGQQQENGSWFYYADNDQGNFIDCFHSCFIIKNLIKIKLLLPEISYQVDPVIQLAWSYLQNNFYDKKSGFCHRFVHRDIKDPFRWDLYDQAEYLGLLIDFNLLEEANVFSKHIEKHFKKGNNWYCRIDIFGRRWGKSFMRWGIVPFLYHKARLDNI